MFAQRFHPIVGAVLLTSALAACQPGEGAGEGEVEGAAAESAQGVVEVIARDYTFQAPAEIPSGWTTFRLQNEGMEVHFLLLNRLPAGKTFEDYGAEVGTPFEIVWDSLRTGAMDKAEAGMLLGTLLPDWYASVKQMGGPGLIGPGGAAETSVDLDPGLYVMECYVKTAEGEFHSALGMTRPLTVTTEPSGGAPPEADIELTLTNEEIVVHGELTAGEHTVAVHFQQHPEVGLGNDVHLARLEEGTDLDEVVRWMDWMEVDGLRAPSPVKFMGGAQEMPVGNTSYFTVTLEPGRYLWIAEPGAVRGLAREFTVEEGT